MEPRQVGMHSQDGIQTTSTTVAAMTLHLLGNIFAAAYKSQETLDGDRGASGFGENKFLRCIQHRQFIHCLPIWLSPSI